MYVSRSGFYEVIMINNVKYYHNGLAFNNLLSR